MSTSPNPSFLHPRPASASSSPSRRASLVFGNDLVSLRAVSVGILRWLAASSFRRARSLRDCAYRVTRARQNGVIMNISDLLTPALIKIGLESEEKEELFEEMVQLFVGGDLLSDRDAALEALFEREAKMSTGISKWLALPHGKLEEADGLLIAIGVSDAGIEYDSLDGEPVYVVIMVFAEIGNPGPHIEALAEISRLFSIPGFIDRVRKAGRSEELLSLIKEEE